MTSNRIVDAPVLSDLLVQIPADERIGSVTADGIHDTRGCHAAIATRDAKAVRALSRTGGVRALTPTSTKCPTMEGP